MACLRPGFIRALLIILVSLSWTAFLASCVDSGVHLTSTTQEPPCNGTGFGCDNGFCVSYKDLCDGHNDCGDDSDEKNCDACEDSPNHFLCDGGKCIHPRDVCDGYVNCVDGTDEQNNCSVVCQDLRCDHDCFPFPSRKGAKCKCKEGFKLLKDGKSCQDLCHAKMDDGLPYCSQLCHSFYYNVECDCKLGYVIQDDQRSCKAEGDEAIIYYANVSEIWSLTLNTKLSTKILSNRTGRIHGLAIDTSYWERNLYWTESDTDKPGLYYMSLEGKQNHVHVIKSFGLVKPMGVAYDFISSNIYVADSLLPAILACETNLMACTQVFNSTVVRMPQDVALHPSEGVMFWTEVGAKAAIMKGSMSGESHQALVTSRIRKPTSLSLDHVTEKLFWLDSFYNEAYSIYLNGSDRMIIVSHKISMPVGLAVFEDEMIWANGHSHDILMANKFKGHDLRTILPIVPHPTALTIGHASLQPSDGTDACFMSDCHLCLLGPRGESSCRCMDGFSPDAFGYDCVVEAGNSPMILATNGTHIIQVPLSLQGIVTAEVLVSNAGSQVFALVYLSEIKEVLFSDVSTDGEVSLHLLHDMDFEFPTILRNQLGDMLSVQSLAVDETSSNVYWIDVVKRTFEVSTQWDFRARLPIVSNHPMALTLNTDDGFLYYADLSPACIHQCRLDGTECFPLVTQRVVEPNYILYSKNGSRSRLFWSDLALHKLAYMDLQTKQIVDVAYTKGKPSSFTVYGKYLFWTEMRSSRIFYKHLDRHDGYASHISTDFELTSLVLAQTKSTKKHGACGRHNGGCEHICIAIVKSVVCLCSNGHRLAADGKSCEKIVDYEKNCDGVFCKSENFCVHFSRVCDLSPDCVDRSDEADCHVEFEDPCDGYECDSGECEKEMCDCADKSEDEKFFCPEKEQCSTAEHWCGSFCLPSKQVCDQKIDCINGTDEADCTYGCGEDQFKCSDICISSHFVCDGEKDCRDGEDEKDCPNLECDKNQFECINGNCIDEYEMCDGVYNCEEGEDEHDDKCQDNCSSDDYTCRDGTCIRRDKICNGFDDCVSGEDESFCFGCRENEFMCIDDTCVPLAQECNGVEECPDGSDEIFCDPIEPETLPAGPCNGFTCSLGQCISHDKRCDGIPHCLDNSDEINCQLTCVEYQLNKKCDHLCESTSISGPRCICRPGFKLVDQFGCVDINECAAESSICSQKCANEVGSAGSMGFQCSCHEDYNQGRDLFSCKAKGPRPYLLVSSSTYIRRVSMDGKNEAMVLPDKTRLEMFDYDYDHKTLYLVESDNTLMKSVNGNDKLSIMFSGLSIFDIAVDWVTHNVYISQLIKSKACISVLSETSGFLATIVADRAYSPGQIVLHPGKGLMFWVSEHRHPARLMRSSMSGSSIVEIADNVPHRKSMIAVDPVIDRLYWYNIYTKKIVSADLSGGQRHSFPVSGERWIYSIDVFESVLFMTHSHHDAIMKFPMFGPGEKQKSIRLVNMTNPGYVKVIHPMKQPSVPNPCDARDCQFMCVLSLMDATCVCPDGRMDPTNPTCVTVTPVVSTPKTLAVVTEKPSQPSGSRCSLKCKSGTCVRDGTKETCRCALGFSGELCETRTVSKDDGKDGQKDGKARQKDGKDGEKDGTDGKKDGGKDGKKDDDKGDAVKIVSQDKEEESSKAWIAGVVIALITLVVIVVVVVYIRRRKNPSSIRAIRFKKANLYHVSNKEDPDEVVPEISFNNPGFQDEIDQEVESSQGSEWWRRIQAKCPIPIEAAFRGRDGKFFRQDPTTSDKVSLLNNI